MSTERMAATKGTLQKAREQLEFIERGKDVLKMKRDQLAGELNGLLAGLAKRKEVDRLFVEALEAARYAHTVLGSDAFDSAARAVSMIEVRGVPKSTVGVAMPDVEFVRRPIPAEAPSAAVMKVVGKLSRAVQGEVELGVLEAKLERLARELMDTNRKVNALEKVVIPGYKAMIRYIEDRLNEQALQEFFVTRRMRDMTREARERRT